MGVQAWVVECEEWPALFFLFFSPTFFFFFSLLRPKQKSLPTVWPGGIRGLGADRGSRGEENLRSLEPADFPIRFREPGFSAFLPGGPPTLRGDSSVGPREPPWSAAVLPFPDTLLEQLNW